MGTGKCDVIASTSIKHMVSALLEKHNRTGVHLATNAIRLSNGQYGAIAHLVRAPNHYTQCTYIFSSVHPFVIPHVCRSPFHLPNSSSFPIEQYHASFAVGLMYVDGKIVVSYSILDSISNFVVTDKAELFGNMVEVSFHRILI